MPLIYPHERQVLALNGLYAADHSLPPVLRLWFPNNSLQWFLTHTRADDPDLAYGLAVEGGLRLVYELGYWSLEAFEAFGRGAPGTWLQSSSVIWFVMPLSGYVRSLARGGYGRPR
jgi:hypothetical protein